MRITVIYCEKCDWRKWPKDKVEVPVGLCRSCKSLPAKVAVFNLSEEEGKTLNRA